MKLRTCKYCQTEKSEEEFYRTSSRCKVCQAQYYTDNKERFKPFVKDSHLKRNYNLSLKEFDSILKTQNGGCNICGREDRTLCVDHCHDTGKVRGILCRQCNTGIGQFNDDPVLIEKALEHLRK